MALAKERAVNSSGDDQSVIVIPRPKYDEDKFVWRGVNFHIYPDQMGVEWIVTMTMVEDGVVLDKGFKISIDTPRAELLRLAKNRAINQASKKNLYLNKDINSVGRADTERIQRRQEMLYPAVNKTAE